MKMNKMFYVTVTLVVMLFIATGCQKQDYDNSIFRVSDEFLNGYGKDVRNVYIMNKSGLYVVGDATDPSIYRDYGLGLDILEEYGATGIYLPLDWEDGKTSACLSYGDIAPVVFNKKKDTLCSKENYGTLSLYPVEYIGKSFYADAMKEYGQVYDDFENVPDCRCYKVYDEEITVYSWGKTKDGDTIYVMDQLESGLYFVDTTKGIIEVR